MIFYNIIFLRMLNTKKHIFVIKKEPDKESTGEHSIKNKEEINLISFEPRESSFDFGFNTKNVDFCFKSELSSISNDLLSNENCLLNFKNEEDLDLKKNGEFDMLLNNYNYIDEIIFKKNRNYFNDNISDKKEKENEKINYNFSSNTSKRCDTFLIKFKAVLGKWFIKQINEYLSLLKQNLIIKRRIKLYSFNYRKFTLNVNYTHNKHWLKYKMLDLLVIGDEENQIKNKKGIKSLFKKDLIELREIKEMLESSYEDIIKRFYLSEEFSLFAEDKRVKELDFNFKKIMNISLLEKFGFIDFFETRQGNKRK